MVQDMTQHSMTSLHDKLSQTEAFPPSHTTPLMQLRSLHTQAATLG